jgi:hypothetical protein
LHYIRRSLNEFVTRLTEESAPSLPRQ